MADALTSNYKGELIDQRTWSGLIEAMTETVKWIEWHNHARMHSAIAHRPPREIHNEAITGGHPQATAA